MKNLKMLGFLFMFILTQVAYPQNVIRRVKNFILIDISESSGYQIGDIVQIYRFENDKPQTVGKAKILRFHDSKCALQIVLENPEIRVGDCVKQLDGIDGFLNPYQKEASNVKPKRNRALSYITLGAGMVTSVIGYNYYNNTVKTYDNYKTADTREDAIRFYDKAEDSYKSAKIYGVIGGAFFATTIFNELLLKSSPEKESRISVQTSDPDKIIRISYHF